MSRERTCANSAATSGAIATAAGIDATEVFA